MRNPPGIRAFRPALASRAGMVDGYVAEGGSRVRAWRCYGGAAVAYCVAGRIALDSSQRFDENSLCRIYSMTKPVTGVAAMILVEEGKLALDQPVADVLPEFRSLRVATDLQQGLESRPAVKTMTMRHLLTRQASVTGLRSRVSARFQRPIANRHHTGKLRCGP